jgi:hypothetical protein
MCALVERNKIHVRFVVETEILVLVVTVSPTVERLTTTAMYAVVPTNVKAKKVLVPLRPRLQV